MRDEWYVYIISNGNHTLYAGMTVDLVRRIEQHKRGTYENAFTRRYNFDRLVYSNRLEGEVPLQNESARSSRGRVHARSPSSNP
jgi:putative endonuclease